MKIREKINIFLSLLIGLLGVSACQHTKSTAKQKKSVDSEPEKEIRDINSEIMLMYGIPQPDDLHYDTIPELLPEEEAQDEPAVEESQPVKIRPAIMVKYGVPPQLR